MTYEMGPRIIALRAEKGLSQEALANELGVSRQAVSRWERGEALPDTENLIALADLFGVSLDQLVRGKSDETAPPMAEDHVKDENDKGDASTTHDAEEDTPTNEATEKPPTEPLSLESEPEPKPEDEAASMQAPEPEPAPEPEAGTPSAQEPDTAPATSPAPGHVTAPEPFSSPVMPTVAYTPPATSPQQPATPQEPKWGIGRVLLLLAASAILMGALAIPACTFFGYVVVPGVSGAGEQEPHEEILSEPLQQVDVDVSVVHSLDISWPSGYVNVIPTEEFDNGGNIRLVEDVTSGSDKPMMTWSISGGTLRIEMEGGLTKTEHTLDVYLPPELAYHLDDVSMEIGSGQAHLASLECNSLEVDLLSGGLDVNACVAGELNLEVMSGSAEVYGTFDKLDLELSSGMVTALCEDNPSNVEIDVSSGSLNLMLPEDCGFTLTSDVAAGNLSVDFPIVHNERAAVHGDGSCTIDISVSSGDVSIVSFE